MRIAAIEGRLLQPDTAPVRFMDSMPPSRFQHAYVCVIADDGTRGEVITYLMNPGEFEHALPGLRSMLVGRDAHEIERVSARLTQMMEHDHGMLSAPTKPGLGYDLDRAALDAITTRHL